MLNVAVQERFLAADPRLAGRRGRARPRARVLAAAFIGFLVERLIRDEPLTGREREVFVDRAAAILEALIAAPSAA